MYPQTGRSSPSPDAYPSPAPRPAQTQALKTEMLPPCVTPKRWPQPAPSSLPAISLRNESRSDAY